MSRVNYTTVLISLGASVFVFLIGSSLSTLSTAPVKCEVPHAAATAQSLDSVLKTLQSLEVKDTSVSHKMDQILLQIQQMQAVLWTVRRFPFLCFATAARGVHVPSEPRRFAVPRASGTAFHRDCIFSVAPQAEATAACTTGNNDVLPQLYHKPVPEQYLNDPELQAIRQKLWDQFFVEKKMSLRSYFGDVRMYPGAFDHYWNIALKLPKGGKIVELGSFFGASTVVWGTALKAIGNTEARIYCVDRFTEGNGEQKRVFDKNVRDYGLEAIVKPIKGESWDSASQFGDGSLDVVYVDAGHVRIDVLKDVGAWFPKLKKGGLMSGHDATPKWEGVLRGAYEWAMLHEDHTLEFACCEPNTAGIWHYRWRSYGPSTTHGGWHNSLEPTKIEGMVWPKLCPK